MGETRRKFDKDFKEGAVGLVRETGKPIAQVARDLGSTRATVGPHQVDKATLAVTASMATLQAVARDRTGVPAIDPATARRLDTLHGFYELMDTPIMSTTFVIKSSQRTRRTLSITDDSGMQRFEVDYRDPWRPGKTNRVSIRDTAGTEVAVISRAGLTHLELLAGGQRITMRPAGFNSRKLKITSAGDRLEVVGDHRQGGTFSIIRGGMSAATVTFGQQSTIAITDGEDPVLMLGLALTIARISSGLAAQRLATRRI